MNEAAKNVLVSTIKEWTKFTQEKEKMQKTADEVASVVRKIVQEQLAFLKTQNIDVSCETPENITILGAPVLIEPNVEATFPNVKTSVLMKCGGAARAIIINPNLSISAGGAPFMFEQLRKAVPDGFATNAAEFVRDAFLNVARTVGSQKEAKPPAEA